MSDGARARLRRLLYVLPAASRPRGAALAELAATLDTSESRILEDIEELTARAYYHPGGWPDDVQIFVESDRVRVTHAVGLDRPVKLSAAETLCLSLALRGTAAGSRLDDPDARLELLARAESHLAADPDSARSDADIAAPERALEPEGIRELLIRAADERRACAIHYVRAGARDGTVRVVHPYSVAFAEGHWYTIAWCCQEEGVRVFRVDRVLAADVTDESFVPHSDFRIEDYLSTGHLYLADNDAPLAVRYSPRIARWLRERAGWESSVVREGTDGSIVIEYRVADPAWAVSLALQYGADAEVVEPEMIRNLVLAVARELAGEMPD